MFTNTDGYCFTKFLPKVLGLYPTNSDPINKFILNDARVEILVVEDQKSIQRILQFRNELPNLKKIIQVQKINPMYTFSLNLIFYTKNYEIVLGRAFRPSRCG